jgi:methyltransferase (TIGR00027 family)
MQEGRSSMTATMVCVGRAIAHIDGTVPGFSDPTALAMLPEDQRERAERFRTMPAPRTLRERMAWKFMAGRSQMMAVRTVAIDHGVRAAAAPQVVILGAGFDGRAWRMPELADTVVFEVDHPDTQREKLTRVSALARTAREVRFVSVDFTRDALADELQRAGHDPTRPTTWVWEGVVMYLTRAEIEATLSAIAGRSTPGSRLIIAYAAPGMMMPFVRVVVRGVGEPFRSLFTPPAMKALLGAYGFSVIRDGDIPTIARMLSNRAAIETRRLGHVRIVDAERTHPAPSPGMG